MIKSTDLRIGNKVKVFGKIYTIKELGEFEAAMEETEGVFSYEDVQGVELTGELLIGCGFEKDGFKAYNISISPWPDSYLKHLSFAGDYLYLREGTLSKNRIEDSLCVLWNNDLQGKMKLHQLQNIFYWLNSGTELTINLEQVKV